ncbi:MAG: Adenylate cyclase [Candidatus Ozemobacter sibiricus]|uniref:Adenylate cyclase n=1 Tax=Candidatus Ozemobacter sibiricus TaxID=2268124 RepID=A0A367ZUN6_9BACT|nr:MAG: Adenylate cyclase [Candidatus Ozemobacter sibiricus]
MMHQPESSRPHLSPAAAPADARGERQGRPRSSWTLRGLGVLFVGLPLILGVVNDRIALSLARQQAEKRALDQARRVVATHLQGISIPHQISLTLEGFLKEAERLTREGDPPAIAARLRRLHRRRLARRLPRHDLCLARFDPFLERPQRLLTHQDGLGFTGPLATAFFEALPRSFLAPPLLDRVLTGLREALAFPVGPELWQSEAAGQLTLMNAREGRRGLFWSTLPRFSPTTDRYRLLLACVLDLTALPRDYAARLLVSRWSRPYVGIGYLRLGQERSFVASRFFRGHPRLLQDLPARLAAHPEREMLQQESGLLILSPPPAPGQGLRWVVAIPVAATDTGSLLRRYPWVSIQILILAGLGTLLGLRERVFRIPIRWSVSAILTGTFLLVVIGPGAGLYAIGQAAAVELEERERQEAGRRLHQRLQSCDQILLSYQGRVIQAMRQVAARPSTLAHLEAELASPSDGRLRAIANSLFDVAPDIVGREGVRDFTGILIAVGAGNLCRVWINSDSGQNSEAAGEPLVRLIAPFSRQAWAIMERRWQNARKDSSPLPGRTPLPPASPGPERLDLQLVRDEIMIEDLRRLFSGMVDSDLYTRLLFYPERQTQLTMNIGRVFTLGTFVPHRRHPRFLLSWLFDEQMARGTFVERVTRTWPESSKGRIFLLNREVPSLPSEPPGYDRHPGLRSLVDRSREGMQVRREIYRGPQGDEVLETLPSQYQNTLLFAGTEEAGNPALTVRRGFFTLATLGFALAIGLALLATWFFLAPLGRILAALQRFQPGQPVEEQPDAARGDEFGTLATAFQAMGEGIRQKDVLGRFVSPTVRRLVADEEFRRRARAGENRQVTVLFSEVGDPAAADHEATVEAVFHRLERHWSALHAVAEETGGEINKVMGDKILVVFDHEALGGATAAARAAVQAAWRLRQRLLADGLPAPLIGLNAGPVIAGLMGSANFRLDYTVIGDTVNLASRLATLAHTVGGSGIVLAGALVDLLPGTLTVTRLPFTRVKGKTQAVEAYPLEGVTDAGSGSRS